jgi:cell volume regulation protein A
VPDAVAFAGLIAVVSLAMAVALYSSRLTALLRVPAPALFLVLAALTSDIYPTLGDLSPELVQRIVTVALIFVLFDGGMHIGWHRFRAALGPVALIGVIGTFLTAGATALVAYALFDFGWLAALLLGAALAATDPAVVFSVLGKQEVSGRSGTIIEGESGVNDPVGIALMVSLVTVAVHGSGGLFAVGEATCEFLLQMVVGAIVGLILGGLLVYVVRRGVLASDALYPLQTMAGAALIYGIATLARGSGFLAVFIAGIMLGDVRAPFKGEIRRAHASLASLGEIVAFAVLGLTVNVSQVLTTDAWWIGLCLAAVLAVVIRPLFVGPLLLPIRLRMGERVFILFAGLKGAVPVLLGTFVFAAAVPEASLIYNVIFVVVLVSVAVQGGLVPWVARRCGVPTRPVEPEPWALGIRFRQEPRGLHRYVVAPGSPADGAAISHLDLGAGVWVSLVTRDGELLTTTGDTVLRPGDEVLTVVDHVHGADPAAQFESDDQH